MDYRLLIAQRYLLGRRSFSLISKVTGISIAGVALGVAALIVVLSVMNGFFTFVRDMLVSLDPHVRIERLEAATPAELDSLRSYALSIEGVESVTPFVEGKALLVGSGGERSNKVVIVRGIDSEGDDSYRRAVSRTGFGTFDVERRNGRPGVVVGRRLGERLVLSPEGGGREASRVTLLSAPAIERSLTRVIGTTPTQQFEVRGLYELEAVYDESYVFVNLPEAQRLFRLRNGIHGMDIRVNRLEQADAVKVALQRHLGGREAEVLTWYDLKKSLYDVMRLEKWGAMAVLALIIVVAAFNIVGSLTMIVIEKRRDVGVLKAMGVTRENILRIFLTEGLLIGMAGAGLGTAIGLGIAWAQHRFELVPLVGADSFLIDAYPVAIQALDVALISGLALLLCVLAAWYPAVRASAIQPARAVSMDA